MIQFAAGMILGLILGTITLGAIVALIEGAAQRREAKLGEENEELLRWQEAVYQRRPVRDHGNRREEPGVEPDSHEGRPGGVR